MTIQNFITANYPDYYIHHYNEFKRYSRNELIQHIQDLANELENDDLDDTYYTDTLQRALLVLGIHNDYERMLQEIE